LSRLSSQFLASILVNAIYEMKNYPAVLVITVLSPLSFLTLIASSLLSWMRAQPGSDALRTLLYLFERDAAVSGASASSTVTPAAPRASRATQSSC